MKEKKAILLKKARKLPKSSGCYLMRTRDGDVIYVGKAKNLRSRVSSYFNNTVKSSKTISMVSYVDDFEINLTENECEALILENTLIKKIRPKYNIILRDDKSYPYIFIDKNEDFSRISYGRNIKKREKRQVWGPFPVGSNIKEVSSLVTKILGLRDCSIREFKKRKKPCLLFQIEQCSGSCVGKISFEQYNLDLKIAIDFFSGRETALINLLEKKMRMASENEKFEQSIFYRDSLKTLQLFMNFEKNRFAEFPGEDRNFDLVSWHSDVDVTDFIITSVRKGLLIGNRSFVLPISKEDLLEEVDTILFDYYKKNVGSTPSEVQIDVENEMLNSLNEGLKIKFKTISKKLKSLHILGIEQAKENLRLRDEKSDHAFLAAKELQHLLGLVELPRKIECFDVAIFQGEAPTASKVVVLDGIPLKEEYRYYHLKLRKEGNNDFAMMQEVVTRRLSEKNYPDIFLIDGGRPQLQAVKIILDKFDVKIPLVGIAKSRLESDFSSTKIVKSEERLVILKRKDSILLTKRRAILKLSNVLRDEAHRFCRILHHKQMKKNRGL